MKYVKQSILFFCFLLIAGYDLVAQSISGSVVDEEGVAVPYANIFIKEIQSGTSADFAGKFYLSLVASGDYSLVISALGYESKSLNVMLKEPTDFKVHITLKSSSVQMNEIVVKADKKDPAYGIIRKVIASKEKYINSVSSSQSEIYLKSIEKLNLTKKNKKADFNEKQVNKDGSPIDPLEEMQRKLDAEMNKINMVEMQLTMHHQAPNYYKEIRNAFTVYGRKESLFIPNLSEVNFSFYRNLIKLKGITDVPIISPISNSSILTYKYKLLESKVEDDGQLVYKIKVTPRKKGNASVSGIVYINEGLWNIRSLELSLYKGSIKFYDKFKISQEYTKEDGVWIIKRQEFDYETKVGGKKNFVGSTLITVDSFENNVAYPAKFFGNEMAVMSKEALERDSAYWKSNRPEALTQEQEKLVHYQDSVQAWITSDQYLDSMDILFNKVELLDVLMDGVSFRNHKKKSNLSLGTLPALIDFEIVGGLRVGPFAGYYRRFEDGRILDAYGRVTMGLRNKDVQGNLGFWSRLDPYKLFDISLNIRKDFESINYNDAILNQLRSSNYYLSNTISFGHSIELLNGLYFVSYSSFADRQTADPLNTNTLLGVIINDIPSRVFEPYQAFITEFRLSYTPQQRYITEPNRKVILGSKFPTFHFRYGKGWNKLLGSDIDYDRVEFQIEHNLTLGIFGTSNYNIRMGDFINQKDVRFIDVKRFNQSNPYWQEDPLYNFNSLDTIIITTNFYFEAHYVHHFNGAIVNNIPLVKKLRVQAVAGAGFLWVSDGAVRHEEILAGLERTFKLGARRRLRLGVFGVLANSNIGNTNTAIRFYVDVIDTWKKNWNF